ncbi:MAG TPA: sulfite exporter TauE/SafE family protein [Acidiphilium sp.]|nr:MAG: hypothetical protein B7Z67_06145 [Acidiphilium sp. 21-60-14]OYV90846.1 MAG: hypothetical protein B7Z57_07125 [Acidiphilium sp. 37-60-79]HQT86944.1 sulfite exporter TauE/SafE family protein [Acidiphilium sp.]HQU24086.1 sulfite exporter TauE/SafE family protein [Acidiphilium sp.]
MSDWLILSAGLAALLGGVVTGFAGFGFGLVFAPVFAILSGSPRQVVFQTMVLGALVSVVVLADARRAVPQRAALTIGVAALIGTPVGLLLLGVLDARTIKLMIAALAIGVAMLRAARLPLRLPDGLTPLAVAGLIGGVLNGCTGMGGPVPAMTVALQRRNVHHSRTILLSFNLASFLVAILVAILSGLARTAWLTTSLWLAPCVGIGMVIGIRAVKYISAEAFNAFFLMLMAASGVLGLLSVLLG